MQIYAIPVLDDNYVWLIEGCNRQCAIVDMGAAAPVIAAVEARGLTPRAVLLTHHHWDHTAGLGEFLSRFAVPVYGPTIEAQSWVTEPQNDGDTFSIPEVGTFQVIATPGHTRGHLVFTTDGAAFTGDTLFSVGCGRLFEGTPEQMLHSLDRIAGLPDDTLIYCGHEYTADNLRFARHAEPDNPAIQARDAEVKELRRTGKPTVPTSLALEKRTNPFLRVRAQDLRDAICRHARTASMTDAAAFATVRRWKDDFDGLKPL